MIESDNIMPSSVLIVLAFLMWVSSKIIFVLFENIVIDHIIKKEHIFRGSIFRKLKLSFKKDGSEIIATIFHATVNAFAFIAMFAVVSHYCDPIVCNYVCDHLLFFSFFDLTITMVILIIQNFIKEHPIQYKLETKSIFEDEKIDPEVLDFIKRNSKRQQEEN